jgi:hypothetical protein
MISKTVLRWLTLAAVQFGVILLAGAGGLIFNPSTLSAAEEDSSAITVVLAGETAPTTGSPTFNVSGFPLFDPFDEPMVASNGNVVFISALSDGNTGIFFKKNNKSASFKLISATNVAIPGAFTPDDYDGPAMSQNGKIAFVASGGSPGFPDAVIRVKNPNEGTLEIIAKTGDTAPGTGGAKFDDFDDLAVNDKGNVAFIATYTSDGGSTFKTGVFLSTKKGIVPIVLNGDALPGTGGTADGTSAGDFDGPWLNNKDDVAFAADDIDAFKSFEGSIFLKRGKKGATLESLLLLGSTVAGGSVTSIGVGRPGLVNGPALAFTAETSGPVESVVGVVVPGLPPLVCVKRGDSAPDTTATFDAGEAPFGNPTISNNAIEFHSELLGDAANPQGIFTCSIFKKKLDVREAVLPSDPKPTGSWGKDLEEDSSSNTWIVFVDEDNPPGPVGVFITKKPGPEPKKDKN